MNTEISTKANLTGSANLRRAGLLVSALLSVCLATGCASTAASKPTTTAALDCRQLGAEIDKTDLAMRAGRERSAIEQAGQRFDNLQTEFAQQGCTLAY